MYEQTVILHLDRLQTGPSGPRPQSQHTAPLLPNDLKPRQQETLWVKSPSAEAHKGSSCSSTCTHPGPRNTLLPWSQNLHPKHSGWKPSPDETLATQPSSIKAGWISGRCQCQGQTAGFRKVPLQHPSVSVEAKSGSQHRICRWLETVCVSQLGEREGLATGG